MTTKNSGITTDTSKLLAEGIIERCKFCNLRKDGTNYGKKRYKYKESFHIKIGKYDKMKTSDSIKHAILI
ncbi:MAG: hypothetical protein LBT03_02715, partial [Holosporales bacterium]|nr:hypothetical protein [Holosporales bacterium]